MRVPLVPAAVLACALALGCGDPPGPTEPADQLAPSFRAERFINISAFVMGGDPSNPLAMMVGYDAGTTPDDACDDPLGQGLNLIGQVIFLPQGGFSFAYPARKSIWSFWNSEGGRLPTHASWSGLRSSQAAQGRQL